MKIAIRDRGHAARRVATARRRRAPVHGVDDPERRPARKPGKIVIQNDSRSITAYRFFGNIQRGARVACESHRASSPRARSARRCSTRTRASRTSRRISAAIIADAARTHGVDPRLVAAVARRESAFNVGAVSPVGACGLMQLMPATAQYPRRHQRLRRAPEHLRRHALPAHAARHVQRRSRPDARRVQRRPRRSAEVQGSAAVSRDAGVRGGRACVVRAVAPEQGLSAKLT